MAGNAEKGRRGAMWQGQKRLRSRLGAPGEAGPADEQRYRRGEGMIELEFLRGLIEAVDQSGIDSLEITRAGTRIRISKTPPPVPVVGGGATPAGAPAATPPPATTATVDATAAAAEAETAEAPPGPELLEVKSPMVGTFYRAPAPEAPPYVEVGSHVATGQTLCILEAMKLMNELESEVDGVIREVLVENAEPVEYGQVLFRIEPNSAGGSR